MKKEVLEMGTKERPCEHCGSIEPCECMSRRNVRERATEKFILGLLFEIDAPREQKEKTARSISTAIFNASCWDKEEFQKVALGYLYEYSGKVPNEQLVAMSTKIRKFV